MTMDFVKWGEATIDEFALIDPSSFVGVQSIGIFQHQNRNERCCSESGYFKMPTAIQVLKQPTLERDRLPDIKNVAAGIREDVASWVGFDSAYYPYSKGAADQRLREEGFSMCLF